MYPHRDKWFDEYENVIEFGHVLTAVGRLETPEAVLRYVEKPWKWDTEYELWCSFQKPNEPTNPKFERFIARLDDES